MLDINFNTPESITSTLKQNFKNKRLNLDLTQVGLAKKSGVSLGSLKRFENSGLISLESLLKLAVVLDCLDDFLNIGKSTNEINSINELLKQQNKSTKKRGRLK